MLNGKNLTTKRPSKKLDYRMYGPFVIEKVIFPTVVRLNIPQDGRIHNVFHMSLVEPFRTSDNQHTVDPEEVLQGEAGRVVNTCAVERVLDSQISKDQVRYLVRWVGYPHRRDWTWEPWEHFFGEEAKEAVRDFHRPKSEKPRDARAMGGQV
jgi:''chromo'' (CHRromatin Organisation MOdifier) domain.